MVTCQSSELGWEVTVELPADFLSLRRGSVNFNGGVGLKVMVPTHGAMHSSFYLIVCILISFFYTIF